MEIQRLRIELAGVKKDSNLLQEAIYGVDKLVLQRFKELEELQNKQGCPKQRYHSKDDNQTQQLGERQSLRKVQA
ncbi:hypothetical protein THOM_1230 [Trachipleistophora hominis]|uniref:Uncharacterized protein n=1 Tax=Trachipleistophora hominis TaxID=72359 RepID=L7JXN2_TRAHO|nr:hypothetical protein THOM_1230 [Trachipleistophora hominis]